MNEDVRGKMRTDVRESERKCSLLFRLYLSNTSHSACTLPCLAEAMRRRVSRLGETAAEISSIVVLLCYLTGACNMIVYRIRPPKKIPRLIANQNLLSD